MRLLPPAHLYLFALLMLHLLSAKKASAQCGTRITSFPYSQDFEATNGGWTPGGTNSDWSWGTPIKPVISRAASGTKCWIAGTLTQSWYANAQNSTLTSPCFDFSALQRPYLRFQIFWETERRYDGASFQYSIDGGTTWTTLGSNADLVTCPSSNWFNTDGITVLGSDGWSGNIQPTAACAGGAGNGSGQWRLAQHEMAALAGQSRVVFRFRFGAGTVCNGYDGFAIDDIWIGEAPPTEGTSTFQCVNSSQVQFGAGSTQCNVSYAWNFGDPASGAANTSTSVNPIHTYSDPGTYTATVTITAPGHQPKVITHTIKIIDVTATEVRPVSCFGGRDAALQAQVVPAGSYSYEWNTTPVQSTAAIHNLGAGSYEVKITGGGACPASDRVTVTQPAKLTHTVLATNPVCESANGTINLTTAGGTTPFQYVWNPGISTGPSASSLPAGEYRITITDRNNCTDSVMVVLRKENPLRVNLGKDTIVCNGQQVLLDPGSFASYVWQDGSAGSTYAVATTGLYWVRVRDASGCEAADSIQVTVDCSDLYFPSAFTPNGDGRNEGFGALGANLAAVRDYKLEVYNRWGGVVFRTTDPTKRWNGKVVGADPGSATFLWVASYQLRGQSVKTNRKGVITLIK